MKTARLFTIALLFTFGLLPLAAAAAECKIERAAYRPLGSSGQTGHADYLLVHTTKTIPVNQSGLVAVIRQSSSKRAHEFGFAFSNGYGRTWLLYSGPDRYRDENGDKDKNEADGSGPDSPIMYFDAGLKLVEAPTNAGQKAPAYLIMPELGGKFWYMGNSDRKFIPPDGLWKITSCK